MKDDLFKELIGSVREAGKIASGQADPARIFRFEPPDVRTIREETNLSQAEFALMIGVSVKTLQNWEQGRRKPEGPAVALLRILKADAKGAIETLHKSAAAG